MLKRYHITLGATTTAGGTVTSASSLMSIGDAKMALDGDEVSCAACNSKGIIKLDGPRRSEQFNSRQVALSDDLCICLCSPPPKLVNSQTQRYQFIDAASSMATAAPAAASQATSTLASPARTEVDDKAAIRLLQPATREPFRQRPYKLQLHDKIIKGTTDEEGFTQPLSSSERASLVAWHVDE
jgi:uncharacterized Zn-binding protein involved in type VI secretion